MRSSRPWRSSPGWRPSRSVGSTAGSASRQAASTSSSSEVQPRSIAYQYGLRPGMVVTEAAGRDPDPDAAVHLAGPPSRRRTRSPAECRYEPVGVAPAEADGRPCRPGNARDAPVEHPDPTHRRSIRPSSRPRVQTSTPIVSLYDDGLDGIRMERSDLCLRPRAARAGGVVARDRPSRGHAPTARHHAGGRHRRCRSSCNPWTQAGSRSCSCWGRCSSLPRWCRWPLALIARIDDERDRRFAGFAATGCAIGRSGRSASCPRSSAPGYGEDLTLWVLLGGDPVHPGPWRGGTDAAAGGPVDADRERPAARIDRVRGRSAPRRPWRSHPTARRSRSP